MDSLSIQSYANEGAALLTLITMDKYNKCELIIVRIIIIF